MIDDLEDLLRVASLYNIRVIYKDLHSKDPRLEGYAKPSRRLIALDVSLLERPIDHVCVLAEEIGHALNPPIYESINYHLSTYWELDAIARSHINYYHSKAERAALVWATEFLIPDERFWASVRNGPWEWWEWLERYEVTDWFMRWKIGFMESQTHFKCRNIIKLEPPKGGLCV